MTRPLTQREIITCLVKLKKRINKPLTAAIVAIADIDFKTEDRASINDKLTRAIYFNALSLYPEEIMGSPHGDELKEICKRVGSSIKPTLKTRLGKK